MIDEFYKIYNEARVKLEYEIKIQNLIAKQNKSKKTEHKVNKLQEFLDNTFFEW